jgi:dipeptidyl aminopeptidase/acylaminoacyl peptidase
MSRSITIRAAVALGIIASSARAQTAAAHFPTNEDLRHTRALADPRLSPDGRLVLLSVTESTVDSAKSHLWIVDIETNSARQLTSGPGRGESQARWSPDGNAVYFTARRGEHTQLFRLPMTGGEAQPFVVKLVPPVDAAAATDAVDGSPTSKTPVDASISSYTISPDGRFAAILVRDPETPGEAKQKRDKADATLVDHNPHGTRVYLLDLRSSALTAVAVAPNVDEAEWSHKSDRLAVVTSEMNNADDLGPASALWIVDVTHPDAPRRVTSAPTTIGGVAWSASDARIFFTAQAAADAPPGYADVYALAPSGGAAANLSHGFNGSIGGAPIAESDDAMLVPVLNGTLSGYTRFTLGAARPEAINLGSGVAGFLGTNDRHTGWVYLHTETDQPPSVYFAKTLGGAGQRLNAPAFTPADWRAVKSSIVSWPSDGRTIEGLLTLPPAASTSKVPLVVVVHGGPAGVFTQTYSAFTQFLIGHGWAVLMPNPRGSTGYGAAFVSANKNDLGGGDYRDIMAGVDYVIAHHPIDASKLALYGYSYGGEMAGFVEGKTDRFKAIVSGAPVIDQFSEYGTEDGSWYDRWYFGKPWEHMTDAWRQSPLSGVGRAKTPFLLLQGEEDEVDPLGQSQEMYRALRQMGVAVELVTFPRENHGGLSRGILGGASPEPWHGFDARQRIAAFFEKAFGR